MTTDNVFGPNHAEVDAYLATLPQMPWFVSVGSPPDRTDAEFVDFHFLARDSDESFAPWGEALLAAEAAIERLEFDHGRVGNHGAIQHAYARCGFLPTPSVDELFYRIDVEYGESETGYHRDTAMYPHELINFPDRLVRGVALELMVADLDSSPTFFRAQPRGFNAACGPLAGTARGRTAAFCSGSAPCLPRRAEELGLGRTLVPLLAPRRRTWILRLRAKL